MFHTSRKQLFARDDPVLALEQHLEEPELSRGQLDLPLVQGDLVAIDVHHEWPAREDVIVAVVGTGPAKDRRDPQQELLDAEGLADVVVGPEAKSAARRRSLESRAVSISTGVFVSCTRNFSRNSKPFIVGMLMSTTHRSALRRRNWSRPSAPLVAVWTWYPAPTRASWSRSRTPGSSSTTRMVVTLQPP